MKNANRMMAVILGCALTVSASCVLAQDWPQWRGPNRDAKVTGFKAPKTWPQQFTKKWKVTVGQGDATPALVGDKLYVFGRQEGNEVALCLDASTGNERWHDQYDALGATGPASGHSGPRSSPAVANGKIVTLGVRGTLSCLDAATGKKLWRKDDSGGAWPQFFTSSSPMIVDGLCIAQVGGRDNGAMVAYDLATGDQKWKWAGDGTAYASPILLTVGGSKLIVTQTEKNVVAVGLADGKLAWQGPFAPQGRTYNVATPIVDGQTIIYGGGGRRGTKAVKIEKEGDGFVAKDLWSNSDNSVQFNTPVLKNGLVFGLSDNSTLFCINAQNGKTAWTAPAPTGGRGGFGSIVDAGAVLLALTPKSQLIVFQPSDKEYIEVASIKVADKETYAYPVVADNRVFVKDQDSVTLWTIE
jgi:outer membrane protein assembly factor BamB